MRYYWEALFSTEYFPYWEFSMIMFDIAEWIANLLVLGIAVIMWAIGIFIVAMLVTMCKQWIDNLREGEKQ